MLGHVPFRQYLFDSCIYSCWGILVSKLGGKVDEAYKCTMSSPVLALMEKGDGHENDCFQH